MPSTSKSIFISARRLEEYRRMFSLSDINLERRFLDVAGGAASFVAELEQSSPTSIAMDPIYGSEPETLQRTLDAGTATALTNVDREREKYNWSYPRDLAEHSILRTSAKQLFLNDFGVRKRNYVPGSATEIPFSAKEFDFALCSHFLFTYADTVSIDDHLLAIREMSRFATCVRVFPVIGFGVDAAPALQAVMSDATARGLDAKISKVRYNFLKGSGEMLEITPRK